jgi:hypothetical protein
MNDWWLSQGDIFSDLPLVDTFLGSGVSVAALPRGHALLVTHDCMLDKCNKHGTSLVEHLTFLRLIDVEAQLATKRKQLREAKDKEQPYRALYIGDVEGFGEAFVDINAPFTHPAELLGTESRDHDDGDRRLAATLNADRAGRLSEDVVQLFRIKWNANWTGMKPDLTADD